MVWEYRAVKLSYFSGLGQKVQSGGRDHHVSGWAALFPDIDPILGFTDVCNHFGQWGWELVTSVATGNHNAGDYDHPWPDVGEVTLIFKRPKADTSSGA